MNDTLRNNDWYFILGIARRNAKTTRALKWGEVTDETRGCLLWTKLDLPVLSAEFAPKERFRLQIERC